MTVMNPVQIWFSKIHNSFFCFVLFFLCFFLNQNSQLSFCNRESSLFHSMIADRENVFCEKLCCAPKSGKLSWSLVLYLDNIAGIRFERYDICYS